MRLLVVAEIYLEFSSSVRWNSEDLYPTLYHFASYSTDTAGVTLSTKRLEMESHIEGMSLWSETRASKTCSREFNKNLEIMSSKKGIKFNSCILCMRKIDFNLMRKHTEESNRMKSCFGESSIMHNSQFVQFAWESGN